MGSADDARRFAANILREVQREYGPSPAARWLAPRMAGSILESQIHHVDRAVERAVRRYEDASRLYRMISDTRRRAGWAWQLEQLHRHAEIAQHRLRERVAELHRWLDAAETFARAVPYPDGAPCFACGHVFAAPRFRDRHACSASLRDAGALREKAQLGAEQEGHVPGGEREAS